MHTATAITVLTSTGRHTGIHIAPPSQQPRKPASSVYNRSAIMADAWKRYREAVAKGWVNSAAEGRRRFAYGLWLAWAAAKGAAKKAALASKPVNLVAAVTTYRDPARAAAIKGELLAIEYSDALGHGPRERALGAELARLTI